MDDKSKVYIFHIGEILLIILLIILLAAFSFTMGYRVGKKHTDKLDGFTAEDQQLAKEAGSSDLKSDEEEDVEKKISKLKEKMISPVAKTVAKVAPKAKEVIKKAVVTKPKAIKKTVEEGVKEVKSDTYNALKEAFDKMDKEESAAKVEKVVPDKTVDEIEEKLNETTKEVKNEAVKQAPSNDKDLKQDSLTNYTGKHTIQLGSYKEVDDAKNFASGFKVRGYNPIIYEVDLSNKGTWYRVNLGVFDSVSEAREYIEKEESLFKGTDYVIGVF